MIFLEPSTASSEAPPLVDIPHSPSRPPVFADIYFPARTIVCAVGKPAGPLFRIASGEALLSMGATAGESSAVGMIGPRALFGLSVDGRNLCTVTALTPLRAIRVFDASLLEIVDGSARLLHDSYTRNARFAQSEAAERLAAFLVERAKKRAIAAVPATVDIHVPLKRFELASYLCMTGETLSRTIKALRDRGLIETPNPSTFRLFDFPGLCHVAR